MIPFSYIHNKGVSISFVTRKGKMVTVVDTEAYEAALDLVRQLTELKSSQPEYESIRVKLEALTDVRDTVIKSMSDRITIKDDVLYYEEYPIHNTIAKRIIEGARDGENMTSYINFLENLMLNPSNQTVEEIYDFMESNSMGITDDGYLLAYKRVRSDFKDIYTGTMDNSVGQVVKMPRHRVNDNRLKTCSHGLHACAMSYLPHYGTRPENTIVIVKINPRDVVSIPVDYKNAKMRCCEYLVLGEYDSDDKDDILATKYIWSSDDLDDSFGRDYDEDDDFDDDQFYDDDDTIDDEYVADDASDDGLQGDLFADAVAAPAYPEAPVADAVAAPARPEEAIYTAYPQSSGTTLENVEFPTPSEFLEANPHLAPTTIETAVNESEKAEELHSRLDHFLTKIGEDDQDASNASSQVSDTGEIKTIPPWEEIEPGEDYSHYDDDK